MACCLNVAALVWCHPVAVCVKTVGVEGVAFLPDFLLVGLIVYLQYQYVHYVFLFTYSLLLFIQVMLYQQEDISCAAGQGEE